MTKRGEAGQFPARVLATMAVGWAALYGLAPDGRLAMQWRHGIPEFISHVVSDVDAGAHAVADLAFGGNSAPAREGTVAVASADKLSDLFVQVGYALDDVRTNGEVPRLFLASLPDDLLDLRVPAERKRLFIKATLPLILYANEAIARDRRRVEALRAGVDGEFGLSSPDSAWLDDLARVYRLDRFDFDELLLRLDIVPPSLAIAQAAAESGWGTSRFARLGNALFGQRTFGAEAGLVPLKSDGQDRHRVRAFDDLVEAVKSYAFNLNSHPAYAEFRERRSELRRAARALAGSRLVGSMHRYSEQGVDYVRFLETLIRTNDLESFDDARLLGAASVLAAAGSPGI